MILMMVVLGILYDHYIEVMRAIEDELEEEAEEALVDFHDVENVDANLMEQFPPDSATALLIGHQSDLLPSPNARATANSRNPSTPLGGIGGKIEDKWDNFKEDRKRVKNKHA